MELSMKQAFIWGVACTICLSFVYHTALTEAVSESAALCPSGSFLKRDLYCVPDCGPGYFGHSTSRTCRKCSSSCKTCINGKSSDKCSSCDPPLYLKGNSCVQNCENSLAKSPPVHRIRLVGSNHFEGRVEVFHDGSWGTVCDDSWDVNDANVVCRELLLGNAQEAVSYGRLGQGSPSQPIWLSMVNCAGNESRLEECQHAGWGNHSCGHFEDAGVRCKGPDTNRECVPSCGDGYYVKKSQHHCGPCSANCLTCDGSPTTCTSCDSSKYLKDQTCVASCGEGMYGNAVIRRCKSCDPGCRTCADGESPEICTSCPDDRYLNGTQCVVSCAPFFVGQKRAIRLAGINRNTELEGRVEVFRNGAWGTVCDKTFDFREATVACRQLGLGRALRAVKKGYYGRGTGPVWSDLINCTGREQSLFSCPYGPPSPRRFMGCYHSLDVGVACAGPQNGPPLSNRCLKKCNRGWYKNDFDICDECAAQCAECRGTSQRCTNCSAPSFVRNNNCFNKCAGDEYGHLPSRQCRKCNKENCMTCVNSGDNCTSCKPPKTLQDGKCESSCKPLFYQKQGVCVKDCGVSFYAHDTNRSCLRCPHDCVQCTNLTSCSLCAPPLVFENSRCVANCSEGRLAVPFNMSLQTEQRIRLSNGSDYLEGVLEVKHEGVWGTVCDDGWDKRESDVVCRQLNMGSAVQGVSLTHIKKGTGKQWLDDVFCIGNEKSLMDCRHRQWGETNCGHDEDAVLRCSGPGFRKCQGSCLAAQYNKGKECFHCNIACANCSESPNMCGKCAKGYLKKEDTCVADCGYGYYLDGGSCRKCAAICGDCVGKTDNCTSCQKPLYKNGQTCVGDCPNYNPPLNPIVRLRDGKTSFEGRVEVYHNGEYGTVCDDSWDLKDAQVVCRMLGMGNAAEAVSRARFGRGTGRVWMDDVNCVGDETSLPSCPFRGWERENCDHSEDAGVVCERPGNSGDCIDSCDVNNGSFVDDSKGRSCVACSSNCKTCTGNPDNCTTCFPEMFLNKTTSTNTSNCVKTCRARYFSDRVTRSCLPCNGSCFSCEGVAGNCTTCDKNLKLSGSKCVSQCAANEKLLTGVEGIRLVGASSMMEGRVEIFYNGEWGTICDDNFDIQDAHVVCRQLKMGTALEARNRGKYGEGTGRIWIDDLQCIGNEADVRECAMNTGGLGSHNCKHIEDAGVKCSGPDMSQICVTTCRTGYFESNNKCERCAPKCKDCRNKADSCQRCDTPYFHHSSDCVTKCPRGYYGNTKNRSCTACDKVCQTCSNGETGDKCQSCPIGLFLNGTSCVKDCGDLRSVSSLFVSKPQMPLVRLVGGGNKQEGRVEVLHDEVWGTVCDDDWDEKEATIVCKELGFGYPKEATKHSSFGKGSGVIWMDNVDCLGYESSITQCRQAGWGLGNCDPDHNEDAGVVCDNTTVEQLSNNYCRKVNTGSCAELQLCDSFAEVTCVDLQIFNQKGEEQSVCLQCPDGFTGDGQRCRAVSPRPPVFDKKPINYTEVTLQDVIKLNCSSSSPLVLPSVWDWTKDGKPLASEDIRTKRITSASGELVIRSAQVEDSGNYRCTLVNSAGFIESNVSVVVVKAFPQIPGVVSANVAMGETATLGCLVSSLPKANITWSFNGQNLTVGGDKRQIFFDSNYTLQIREVRFEDSGTYECYVFNELGAAVADVKLTVGRNIKYNNFKTKVVGKKGGEVTLSCEVEALPMPSLTWKKDGVLVTESDRQLILLTSQGNSRLAKLKIRAVNKADMGRYACVARNQKSIQAMVTRLVLTGPPIIDLTPSDKSVLSGANVSFFCVGVGDPLPSLTWMKDSKQIRPSKTKMINAETGELRFTSVTVEDGGSYTCVYKNVHGEARYSVVLTVDGHAGLGSPKTGAGKSSGLSTGGLAAIVVVSLLVFLVILAVVIYKCRGHPSYKRGDRLMGGGGSTRFSDLKTRVQSSFGRPYDSPYQPQTE